MDKSDPLSGAFQRDASGEERKPAGLAAANLHAPPDAEGVRRHPFGEHG
jgi:hypothetical protein